FQPLVQRAALVVFEMAPGNPAQLRGSDQCAHGGKQFGEHLSITGVIQQRLIIPNEKVIEPELNIAVVDIDAKNVRRDFVNASHVVLPPRPVYGACNASSTSSAML